MGLASRKNKKRSGSGFRALRLLSSLPVLALALGGCFAVDIVPAGNTTSVVDTTEETNNLGNAVCNPFGSGGNYAGAGYDHGLVATLRYLTDDQPRYGNAVDYVTYGRPVNATMFFGNLDIPTRPFDRGFVTNGGVTLLNAEGNTLYEYFSLEFESKLQLTADDVAGDYQLALLADDGALIEVDRGSGWEVVVNDDGVHPTKMACSTAPVRLLQSEGLPLRVRYYQGPRFHIALTMLWRPWDASDPARPINDVECGRSGNSRYFDSTKVPPQPTATYNGLLARGWSVVPPDRFSLPSHIASNPCGGSEPVDTAISGIVPPESHTRSTQMTFDFYSNKADATYRCRIDASAAATCVSPVTYSGLADGSHTFEVYAVEANGTADTTPARYTWIVDNVQPALSALGTVLGSTTATINWSTNEPTTDGLYWGLGINTDNYIPGDGQLKADHSFTLTGLTPNTVYSYIVSGADGAGNTLITTRRTFRTAP